MSALHDEYRRFRAEGTELAGALDDFQQRAGAHYELYRHSEGNFVFPLIAAHGALWGAWHMRRGLAVSRLLADLIVFSTDEKKLKLAKITDFTNTLKDINRQVLVMSYTAYQMTRRFADDPDLEQYIPRALITALASCHTARREGWRLTPAGRRAAFEAAFRWEQDAVVGPNLEAAIPEFDWPVVRALSLRPPIGFAYFGPLQWLWFRDFGDRQERIRHGMRAFDIAMRKGLAHVEDKLFTYEMENSACRLSIC
jgi:hypothetical protein